RSAARASSRRQTGTAPRATLERSTESHSVAWSLSSIEWSSGGCQNRQTVTATDSIQATLNTGYVSESRRVLATRLRLLGDFDAGEEGVRGGVRGGREEGARDGVPANPRSWLVSAGRFKAIDAIRRNRRFDALDEIEDQEKLGTVDPEAWTDPESVED